MSEIELVDKALEKLVAEDANPVQVSNYLAQQSLMHNQTIESIIQIIKNEGLAHSQSNLPQMMIISDLGKKIWKEGGYKHLLENREMENRQIEIHKQREREKTEAELKLAKLNLKIYWISVIVGIGGGIAGILSL